MINYKIVQNYTKAFFEVAKETGNLEIVQEDFSIINKVVEKSPELTSLFNDPKYTVSDIANIVTKAFKGKVNELTFSFITLLISKNRIAILPLIPAVFLRLYNTENNILEVDCQSASPISDALKALIEEKIVKRTNKKIKVNYSLDPSLVGGFKLYLQDELLDFSIAGKLNKLRGSLL